MQGQHLEAQNFEKALSGARRRKFGDLVLQISGQEFRLVSVPMYRCFRGCSRSTESGSTSETRDGLGQLCVIGLQTDSRLLVRKAGGFLAKADLLFACSSLATSTVEREGIFSATVAAVGISMHRVVKNITNTMLTSLFQQAIFCVACAPAYSPFAEHGEGRAPPCRHGNMNCWSDTE